MANKFLSIYIGNDAIRIAEMQNANKAVILCNAAEVNTPDNSVNDGYLVDVTAISEAIRSSIFGRGFTARDVIFTVQSKKIASKDIEIPYVKNEKRLQDILQANSNEYFPMSNATDYCFAYAKLEDFTNEEGRRTRVSAVAAPNDLVRCYYELAKELKLNVKCIDYFGNSIIQLLRMQMTEGRMDMVLQIEKDATYVNMMRGKTLVLQRSVPYGKNAVISALMDVKKISEKDAKTLLSNEMLLDQHVTADEYAETVQYLVSGIGRVVEYHRSKNVGDALQGIKIFGEGSAIAGIEKILERELGAPVQHFETLTGVQIKGQAALTAEEVLRYLPNIGAVIQPMQLKINLGRRESSVNADMTAKFLLVVFILACIFMAGWCGLTFKQHKDREDEVARLQSEIQKIEDIEQVALAFEEAWTQYNIVKNFEAGTHSDNEQIYAFFKDLEQSMPTESYISGFNATDGDISFSVTSGWHTITKNELADVMNTLRAYDYISGFFIAENQEEYMKIFVVEADEETEELGDYVYLLGEPTDEWPFGAPVKYEEDAEYPEEYEDYVVQTFVRNSYTITCHISRPVEEESIDKEYIEYGELYSETLNLDGGADTTTEEVAQ